MTFLETIQANLIDEDCSLNSILLKFRLFASKLGSELLEDWVRYESEGYPDDIKIPNYRKIDVGYHGTFSGPFGSGIQNAPIPPAAISTYAGEEYLRKTLHHSISGIENLVSNSNDTGTIQLEGGNLMILLNGKVYPNYSCIGITGTVSTMAIHEALNAVRTKLLDLTIAIVKKFPNAAGIEIGSNSTKIDTTESEKVTEVAQSIIYGNQTIINNSGKNNNFNLNIDVGNTDQFTKFLIENGIGQKDANELGDIIKTERPEKDDLPFGKKAQSWLAKNIGKSFSGAWKATGSVATALITEAAKKYYGLD